ncbi:hypothetical protein J6500_21980 [Bradyrhizobium sp. WSM 1704]|uniref:hypothetical protein n=1 Tax=Bradyrhizobium semiaridum TaxID=2821404 RepID=UPI001CE3B4F5|nr:hypothetical protein [Bradyrhizobium semiaridum]MCA6124541.1 hypothetical protein [Bradyrhizobium semiaridum]
MLTLISPGARHRYAAQVERALRLAVSDRLQDTMVQGATIALSSADLGLPTALRGDGESGVNGNIRKQPAPVPESDELATEAREDATVRRMIETNRHLKGVDLADPELRRFNGFSNPDRAYWSGHFPVASQAST